MLSINRARPLRRIGVEIRQSKRPAQLAVLGAALAALAIAAWAFELEGESFNKSHYVTMFVWIPCSKAKLFLVEAWQFDTEIMVATLPSLTSAPSCYSRFSDTLTIRRIQHPDKQSREFGVNNFWAYTKACSVASALVQNEISQGQVLAPLSAEGLTPWPWGENHTLKFKKKTNVCWTLILVFFFLNHNSRMPECYWYGSQPIQGFGAALESWGAGFWEGSRVQSEF